MSSQLKEVFPCRGPWSLVGSEWPFGCFVEWNFGLLRVVSADGLVPGLLLRLDVFNCVLTGEVAGPCS